MLRLLADSPGLWAATLSHEVSHTGLRQLVRDYLQRLYIRQTIDYYRARANAGDSSANYALLGFSIAAPIAFALHHLLRMRTGEQSKFAAFFSDHPRWETRDQRSERAYADALAEYSRLWPDPTVSPGGPAPAVAFVGQVKETEDKGAKLARVTVPLYCRNTPDPVRLLFVFFKDNKPLHFRHEETVTCPEKEESTPTIVSFANPSSDSNRKFESQVFALSANGDALEESSRFKVLFPK